MRSRGGHEQVERGGAVRAGDRLAGRYELIERIGAGGMGEVWRGTDQLLQRPVAVKVIRDGADSPVAVARFRREATIGARLRHPGITVVHDVGRDGDRLFIVMELLEGRDLAAVITEAPEGVAVEEALILAAQIMEGMGAAHGQGVVHRDLKPANLFLHEGRVKICDFGIASAHGLTVGLTGPDGPGGTALYMAPEQWRGEEADARCDLYAIGCVLFQLLTGSPPFTGERYVVMRRHIEETAPLLRTVRPDAPAGLERLVAGLLEKDRQARPAGAHEVLATLRSLNNTASPAVPPPVGYTPTELATPSPSSTGAPMVETFLTRADAAGDSGDFTAARDLALVATQLAQQLLEPDDHQALTARHALGRYTGNGGDPTTARDLYQTLVPDRTRILGPDHPDTLKSRNNLGIFTGNAGNPATARDLLTEVAADSQRALGPDHTDTLMYRDNL
ncbi:protein kinase, partial [Streptomyces sp. NPDC059835]|uniref:serine/threonine-protein kinase n=1 Tax=Streptomyces sp. NPDC059835 TaxID=3346967 RepID=UPI0036500CDF